jgi:hypothetical protein
MLNLGRGSRARGRRGRCRGQVFLLVFLGFFTYFFIFSCDLWFSGFTGCFSYFFKQKIIEIKNIYKFEIYSYLKFVQTQILFEFKKFQIQKIEIQKLFVF